MSSSDRFRTLTKELNRLKRQFLPKINPTGTYSERHLALTIAYRVLAHAEIEAYLEDRVGEVAIDAVKDWKNRGKISRTLLSLLAFSGQMMDVPPNKLASPKGIRIDEKIESAITFFMYTIKNNHGIKESNILSLLLPIGVDVDELDSVLLATLNTFGKERGLVAHSSATSYRTNQLPDPANELNIIQLITQGLLQIDKLINALIR
jgi:hypothetical protein